MNVAVIITTYNRPDALAAALDGYAAQDTHAFEVIVADDGSTHETPRLIAEHAKTAPFPLLHVWQEDRGFRAAAIRNRALARTQADYVIFSDGDCVPPRHFVSRHCALAEPGYFLSGNRILLSERFTARVLRERLPIHAWRTGQWLGAWVRRDVNRALPLIALPDGAFRKHAPARWKGVKTCNFSAWRRDLLAVNGLDEAYSGWGLEDSDLVVRLIRAGIRHKSARFAAPVFHLWHREFDRSRLAENQLRLNEVLSGAHIEAANGVKQYL
jgi:glycosyltransferase involved in cell wall biosynthesis